MAIEIGDKYKERITGSTAEVIKVGPAFVTYVIHLTNHHKTTPIKIKRSSFEREFVIKHD